MTSDLPRARRNFATDRVAVGPGSAQPLVSSTVSGGSARLRALAALSGSLTDALTPEAAAYLVEQKALTALGA
jgi:hypothetical protein